MTSNENDAEPDAELPGLDWLNAPAFSGRLDTDDGSIETLSWEDPNVSAEITKVPSCRELVVLVQRRFTIVISDGVDLPDDFTLRLCTEPGVPAKCDIRIPARRIVCGPRPASLAADLVQHTLFLSGPTHLTIHGDHWNIEPQPGVSVAGISLEATNAHESLSIRSSVPITSLESNGDHEYSMDLEADAAVEVHSGTASFRRRLQSVLISGKGNVRALGATSDCHVEVAGALEVHRELANSEISIGGLFRAMGPVRLGQRSLRCESARLSDALESVGEVQCEELQVEGPVVRADTISVGTLDCRDSLTAGEVTASGNIAIRKNAKCGALEGGGDIAFHQNVDCGRLLGSGNIEIKGDPSGVNSLTWNPNGTGNRLEFRHPDARIPLVFVEAAGSGGAPPELHLAQGSEIQGLHADVPKMTIAIVRDNASRESDRRAAIGLHLGRNGTVLRLAQDTLQLSLAESTPRFSLEIASPAKIEVLECLSDLPMVSILGDGEVRFADDSTSARLRRVDLTGRLQFGSSMHIDELAAAAWPPDTPEAAAEEANPAPRLRLDPGIVVARASGVCRLDHLQARITGDPKRDFTTEHVASSGSGDGHLTNVNVNHLPDNQIPLLKNLRVLEVSGSSLKRLAGERTRVRSTFVAPGRWLLRMRRRETDDNALKSLTRDQVRARAETAAQLADILGGKVNSGASRAWLHWAVARLQHRGVNRWSIERPLRAAYRTMGYGYRPRPALQTWLATALVGLAYAWLGGYAGDAADISFGWQWIERFIEILLLPIGYLRLGATEASAVFKPAAADLLGRIIIGLPFLFVVLGTRQYFRSPVGQGQSARE